MLELSHGVLNLWEGSTGPVEGGNFLEVHFGVAAGKGANRVTVIPMLETEDAKVRNVLDTMDVGILEESNGES